MNSKIYTLLGALGLEDQLVRADDADRACICSDLYAGVKKRTELRMKSENVTDAMHGIKGSAIAFVEQLMELK